jgi:radical SAM protein with 4Fe4S-binding SPASM domain
MNGVLDYVYIRLTKKCNLNCSHCSVDATNRSKTELSETSVKKLIDELYDMMVPNISFTGGEPTLVKNLLSYVEYANQKPMRVSLLTNGFIVNQQLAKDLVKNGLKQVNISLDGACAKSHDQFRGKSGAFEKALNAIKLFKEEGIFTETTTVLHSGNSTEIEDILKLGQSIELDNMKFLPIIPFNRGEKCDYKTSFEIYKKNIKALLPFLTTSQDSENLASAKKYKHSIKCNAGTGVLSIDSNGDVLPCNNFDIMPLGNIFDRPIFDIYTNARKSKELKNALKISDTECTACPLLDDCRGGCPMVSYAYFKDFHKCDITRKLIAEEVISLRRRRYNHERL